MADVDITPLPPEDAIAFFREKGIVESFSWQDVSAQEHAAAFTVAKAMRRDVLYDIREAVDRALSEGRTFEQFRRELQPLLVEKGWWGRRALTDPLTGREREVQLGSVRRLRTIFDVNLRTAYAAGRWQRIEATKRAFPYLRYAATGGKAGDGRTRPEHRAWHGTVLPVDDSWWETHYPPCDFGCRCWAEQVSQRMLERRGWPITTEPVKFPPRPYVNRRTGETRLIETGISPAFGFNPGKARLAGLTPSPGGAPPGPAAMATGGRPPIEPRTIDIPRADLSAEDAQRVFFRRFSLPDTGGERIWTDLGGEPVAIGPRLFRQSDGQPTPFSQSQVRGIPMAATAIRDPDEIRWVWGGAGGAALVRRYIRRGRGIGGEVDVVVDTVVGGAGPAWSWRTSLDGPLDLDAHRGGVLAWRRLPAPLMAAVSAYTGPDYAAMNRWLRFGEGVGLDDGRDLDALVAGLDEVLAGRRLTRRTVLWRGIGPGVLPAGLRVGDELVDDGFMSTSTDRAEAELFQRSTPDGVLLRIIARPGAQALDVSRLSSVGTSEREVLFARGARLRVLSYDPDARTLTVETVVDRPAAQGR